MLFNSTSYLLFLLIVMLVFYILPCRDRRLWLLLCSYYFYMCWNPIYLILLFFSTISTFACGLLLEHNFIKANSKSVIYKKIVITFCIIVNIGILLFFKYSNFIIINLNRVIAFMKLDTQLSMLDLLLPVGISFYTFQVIGYIIDVYREKICAEHNFVQYALFVSFFPQICAGPIERSSNMLHQFEKLNRETTTYSAFVLRVQESLPLILWGFFEKIVIADRATIIVDAVFNNYTGYSSLDIIFATILYGIQIYCDFDGYSNIARGSAALLGIKLMTNFKQPYLAVNIKDFWSRWHISLTTWFTDYLYIPLGGNRKGECRKYINTLIVFAVSGLWHGASWHYMVWGAMHGIFLIIYNFVHKRLPSSEATLLFSSRLWRALITFILADFAWLFFRAQSFRTALGMIEMTITSFSCHLSFPNELLSQGNMIILIVSVLFLFLIDILHEKSIFIMNKIFKQQAWFYLCTIACSIFFLLVFGVFGGGGMT